MTSTEVETRKGAEAAPQLPTKPLNQTQVRNLTKILEGDFDSLLFGIQQMIRAKHTQRTKEIAAKYGDDDALTATRRECEELGNELNLRIREWEDTLVPKGIQCTRGAALEVRQNSYHLHYIGNDHALTQVNKARDNLMRMATDYVQQLKRQAERTVLVASVTGSVATNLLGEIPSASDALEAVLAQLEEHGGDDVQMLVGDQPIV